MLGRLIAIAAIFIATSIAWLVLGGTIFSRTYSSDSALKGKVVSTWGGVQEQKPPSISMTTTSVWRELPIEASRIQVTIDLDPRQKGLLWYNTYRVAFAGRYTVVNAGDAGDALIRMPLPDDKAVYDNLTITVDGQPVPVTFKDGTASASTKLAPGQRAVVNAQYRSQGMEVWKYSFGSQVTRVNDFELAIQTNFRDVDFADNTLSPTSKREIPNGWELTWRYNNLVSGVQIALNMPEKLQPGPLAGEISLFAPVSLLFFFFLMLIITTLRRIELHPMNYFFLAGAFFSFHLLLAYLVDHISIHAAFLICSAVSMLLVTTYLRLVVGTQFAFREAAAVQFIYLILFSYAFFFKGFTGLTVTIGGIVTLFAAMQLTGRVRWSEKFGTAPVAPLSPRPSL